MSLSQIQDGQNQKMEELKTVVERQKEAFLEVLHQEMQSTSTDIENALHRKLTRELEL